MSPRPGQNQNAFRARYAGLCEVKWTKQTHPCAEVAWSSQINAALNSYSQNFYNAIVKIPAYCRVTSPALTIKTARRFDHAQFKVSALLLVYRLAVEDIPLNSNF